MTNQRCFAFQSHFAFRFSAIKWGSIRYIIIDGGGPCIPFGLRTSVLKLVLASRSQNFLEEWTHRTLPRLYYNRSYNRFLYQPKFLDSPLGGPRPRRRNLPGSPRSSHNSNPENGILVRVITPTLAHENLSRLSIPLFNQGRRIPLSTTLRQFKMMIAQSLGRNMEFPRVLDSSPSCNCSFADKIASHGIWAMLRCRDHQPGCELSHEAINNNGPCVICSVQLRSPCPRCQDNIHNSCPLVANAGCNHVFHYHCYAKQSPAHGCPAGCPTTSTNPFKRAFVLTCSNPSGNGSGFSTRPISDPRSRQIGARDYLHG